MAEFIGSTLIANSSHTAPHYNNFFGGDSFPDYLARETINRISVNNGTWVADRDGFVHIDATVSTVPGRVVFSVSGIEPYIHHCSVAGQNVSDVLRVRRGQVISILVTHGTFANCRCRYIPPLRNSDTFTFSWTGISTCIITPTNGFVLPTDKTKYIARRRESASALMNDWTVGLDGATLGTNVTWNAITGAATINMPTAWSTAGWVNADIAVIIGQKVFQFSFSKAGTATAMGVVTMTSARWIEGDLVSMPSYWPRQGHEQDFGDGTFGRLYSGTITGAANAVINTTLLASAPNMCILSCGGSWSTLASYTDSSIPIGHSYSDPSANPQVFVFSYLRMNVQGLALATRLNTARTNAPFHAWIRYRKL